MIGSQLNLAVFSKNNSKYANAIGAYLGGRGHLAMAPERMQGGTVRSMQYASSHQSFSKMFLMYTIFHNFKPL